MSDGNTTELKAGMVAGAWYARVLHRQAYPRCIRMIPIPTNLYTELCRERPGTERMADLLAQLRSLEVAAPTPSSALGEVMDRQLDLETAIGLAASQIHQEHDSSTVGYMSKAGGGTWSGAAMTELKRVTAELTDTRIHIAKLAAERDLLLLAIGDVDLNPMVELQKIYSALGMPTGNIGDPGVDVVAAIRKLTTERDEARAETQSAIERAATERHVCEGVERERDAARQELAKSKEVAAQMFDSCKADQRSYVAVADDLRKRLDEAERERDEVRRLLDIANAYLTSGHKRDADRGDDIRTRPELAKQVIAAARGVSESHPDLENWTFNRNHLRSRLAAFDAAEQPRTEVGA